MIRVKDAEKSVKFYEDNFGMKLKRVSENASANFNLYFLGYGEVPSKDLDANGVNPQANSEGLLELTWNYGTEKDDKFSYYDGNTGEIQGFGHICVSTDNVQAACAQLESNNVKFSKRLTDGRMKELAFALGMSHPFLPRRECANNSCKTLTDIALKLSRTRPSRRESSSICLAGCSVGLTLDASQERSFETCMISQRNQCRSRET